MNLRLQSTSYQLRIVEFPKSIWVYFHLNALVFGASQWFGFSIESNIFQSLSAFFWNSGAYFKFRRLHWILTFSFCESTFLKFRDIFWKFECSFEMWCCWRSFKNAEMSCIFHESARCIWQTCRSQRTCIWIPNSLAVRRSCWSE